MKWGQQNSTRFGLTNLLDLSFSRIYIQTKLLNHTSSTVSISNIIFAWNICPKKRKKKKREMEERFFSLWITKVLRTFFFRYILFPFLFRSKIIFMHTVHNTVYFQSKNEQNIPQFLKGGKMHSVIQSCVLGPCSSRKPL